MPTPVRTLHLDHAAAAPVLTSERTLREDDRAVAPIIGVLLAVGITVLLGGVVYLVSTTLTARSQDQHIAPRIGFVRTISGIQVASTPADPPVDWLADLRIAGTCVSNTHLTLNTVAWPPAAGTKVSPGDTLGGCAQGESITISHPATNTVVYTYQF
jgi:flagellin-like protein